MTKVEKTVLESDRDFRQIVAYTTIYNIIEVIEIDRDAEQLSRKEILEIVNKSIESFKTSDFWQEVIKQQIDNTIRDKALW